MTETDYSHGLNILQVELSTVCNALCLGCVRTDNANFNTQKTTIPKAKYLDIRLIKELFLTEASRSITKIEFCGNIDEPLAHPDLLPLLEHLHGLRPDLRVSIHTNGGLGTPETFEKISRLLCRFESESNFRFSIDGLSDTNSIYRQNVKWDKVIENLRAATSGGGKVIWQFLTFPWNLHQVDAARAMAIDTGCTEFWVRPDRSSATEIGLEKIQLRKQAKNRQNTVGRLSELRSYARMKGHPISCSFKQFGMLFLSWEGKIWPCCFISNVLYESDLKKRVFAKHFTSRYPENFNDLHHHTFDEILAGPLFKKDLMQSWKNGGADDKLAFRCVERCSVAKIRSSDKKVDDRKFYSKLDLKGNVPLPT